ncbi:MAG: energy transducer TonB [Halioglobus sp.]
MALVAHAAVVLGVSFEAGDIASAPRQIEITLATRPSTIAPEDAERLAQANQTGSGDTAEETQIMSAMSPPSVAAMAQENPTESRDQQSLDASEIITTSGEAARAKPSDTKQEMQSELQGISPEVDRLNQELANLEAELNQQTQMLAQEPRVRRLTAASAKQSADAAYLMDWRRRLEAVGNKYYPEASVRYGLYGNVRLLVIIRSDGTLENVKVLSSSGFAVLDEAAIKVVRMAAPYSPFPAALRATTDKLEIVRTWQYLENQLSSAQR